MDQNKIGIFIKNLRLKNNLTQNELADKLGVTYQAVSKWENGKNIPDISILKAISEMFNVNVDDLLNGKETEHKKDNKWIFIIIGILSILIIILLIIILTHNSDYEFKTLESQCSQFKITGSAAYNKDKSSIYISNIDYCGHEDKTIYTRLECILYEESGETSTKISEYSTNNEEKLENYLREVSLSVSNSKTCRNLKDVNLYLVINATDQNNKTITYKVPLTLNDTCQS